MPPTHNPTFVIRHWPLCLLAAALLPASPARTQNSPPATAAALDRTHLPMPNEARPGLVVYDAKNPDAKYPPLHNYAHRRARPTC